MEVLREISGSMQARDERNDLKVLGLESGASDREIRRAYRRLALAYHPDQCGPDGTERFREIQSAYENLTQQPEPTPPLPSYQKRNQSGPEQTRPIRERMMSIRDVSRMMPPFEPGHGRTFPVMLSPEEAFYGGWMRLVLPITQSIPTSWGACEIRRSRIAFEIFLPSALENGMILTVHPPVPGADPVNLQIRIPSRSLDFRYNPDPFTEEMQS